MEDRSQNEEIMKMLKDFMRGMEERLRRDSDEWKNRVRRELRLTPGTRIKQQHAKVEDRNSRDTTEAEDSTGSPVRHTKAVEAELPQVSDQVEVGDRVQARADLLDSGCKVDGKVPSTAGAQAPKLSDRVEVETCMQARVDILDSGCEVNGELSPIAQAQQASSRGRKRGGRRKCPAKGLQQQQQQLQQLQQKSGGRRNADDVCHNCERPGHHAKDCPKPSCGTCNGKGHRSDVCVNNRAPALVTNETPPAMERLVLLV